MCEYLGVFMIGCWLIEGWWLLVARVPVLVVPVWNKHMLSTGHVGILLAALVHVAVHIIWDTLAKPRNGSNSILLSRS